MSIIADALTRLQTQAEEAPKKPVENQTSRPIFNKGEGSGRHRKDSPYGFLMVMVGMTIILGSLALGAFWIGGHLNFGLASHTLAHIPDNEVIPRTHNPIGNSVSVDHSSRNDVAANSKIPLLKIDLNPSNGEKPQTSRSLSSDSAHTSPSPSDEPSESEISAKESNVPPTIGDTLSAMAPDQGNSSPSGNQPNEMEGESMQPSQDMKEHSSTEDSIFFGNDNTDFPQKAAKTLQEEILESEEFAGISHSARNSPEKTSAFSRQTIPPIPIDQGARSPVVSQASSANRLRQAQQLIRSGEYEGAVALLSPLFHDPPVKWQPWFWMGTALLGKGDMEQADQFLLSGLARNDRVPQLWIQRALVAQQRGDFQLAIHELRQAESLDAELPHIHLNLGYAYERLGNDQLANQYYANFLKLSEGQPDFFSTRKKLFARLTQQIQSENPSHSPP